MRHICVYHQFVRVKQLPREHHWRRTRDAGRVKPNKWKETHKAAAAAATTTGEKEKETEGMMCTHSQIIMLNEMNTRVVDVVVAFICAYVFV